MNEENLPSVEAALAAPQNAPAAPSSLAPQPASPETAAPPAAAPAPAPDQRSQILEGARRFVNEMMRGVRSGYGGAPQQPQQPQTLGDMLKGLVSGEGAAPSAPAPTSPAPTSPALSPSPVKMMTPLGGGRAFPTYDHNGMTVILGDDIDVNDAAAVQGRMSETNDLIDMMNNAYEEY